MVAMINAGDDGNFDDKNDQKKYTNIMTFEKKFTKIRDLLASRSGSVTTFFLSAVEIQNRKMEENHLGGFLRPSRLPCYVFCICLVTCCRK